MVRPAWLAGLIAAAPCAPAHPQAPLAPLHPYCASRPSLGAGACIADVGHPMLEMGIGSWEHDRAGGATTYRLTGGETLIRVGTGARTELQIGWTAIAVEQTTIGGGVSERRTGIGDVTLALRRSLRNPDGSGLSIAVQPHVTVPVAQRPIGAGSWSIGVLVPIGYQLNDSVQIQFTGAVDAAADADGHRRHAAWSGIGGIAVMLSETVSTTTEVFVGRDDDPAGGTTTMLAAFSGGRQIADDSQIDAGITVGLNGVSPDRRLFFGFSHRF